MSLPTPPHTFCSLDSSPPTEGLLPSLAGITRLQRWHRAEQMGLEPPPEVRQVLQTHLGDPRFQFRSETGQGGLSGELEPSPGTASLLTLGVGAALTCRKTGAGLEGLAEQARKFYKLSGSGGQNYCCLNSSYL